MSHQVSLDPYPEDLPSQTDFLDDDEDEDESESGWPYVVPPVDGHGRVRLMADKCSTCIFRPGNKMYLEPGRVAGMLASVRANDGYVPCHKTIGVGITSAICRGGNDAHRGGLIRLVDEGVLPGVVEVTEAEVLAEQEARRER